MSLAEEYAHVVSYLTGIETEERIRALPHLVERAPPIEIDDCRQPAGTTNTDTDTDRSDNGDSVGASDDGTLANLRHKNLRAFSLSLLPSSISSNHFASITTLDVGYNELADLPGLSSLSNLTNLILTRNWFKALPTEIGTLSRLRQLDASRNFLRPNSTSLRFDDLRTLSELHELDLSYNQKCGRPHHRDLIQREVPQLTDIKISVWEKICSNPGSYVGASAAERDAALLRSQLEAWAAPQLRRRLVCDFGEKPTDPTVVDRADVMRRLLLCYHREGLLELPVMTRSNDTNGDGQDEEAKSRGSDLNLNDGVGRRRIIQVRGTPVRQELLDDLLTELRSWRGDRTRGGSESHRERPSIRARCYMILRAPDANDRKLEGQVPESSTTASRRAQRVARKMERNRKLWDMALEAMTEVDPGFATRCTEMAVTFGFTGSPHIDKQNCGPFYGLALGDFTEGTGQVCVECSARVLAAVDTKNRLGRIDGRHPHWVMPYDADEERFSLIYYETGGKFVAPGPAVFSLPA